MRLLDLYCGAGGASTGYANAGFEVTGVDNKPQPRYPFTFLEMDVLDLSIDFLKSFDVIHASPPCQLYSHATVAIDHANHVDLIAPTRERLKKTRRPYVIENVPRAPLIDPVRLCGAAFDLTAKDLDGTRLVLKRHRLFESNRSLTGTACGCRTYKGDGFKVGGVYGGGSATRVRAETIRHGGYVPPKEVRQDLMGIKWMSQTELNQAIPPIYTFFLGVQLKELTNEGY